MATNLWQRGVSGNPAGRKPGSRNRLSEAVICALLRDFSKHGEKAIAKVRRTHPAAYLKICVLLVPRENKVEHVNPVSGLSDEELDAMIQELQERIAAKAAAVKIIEGKAVEQPALPAPAAEPRKRRNRILAEADTAIGPRERSPRKRKVPPPPGA